MPRCASSNASRSDEMRYCASPSCEELTSSINKELTKRLPGDPRLLCLLKLYRIDSRCQSFTARRGPSVHFADLVVARTIIGCAARPSSASRYNIPNRNLAEWQADRAAQLVTRRYISFTKIRLKESNLIQDRRVQTIKFTHPPLPPEFL